MNIFFYTLQTQTVLYSKGKAVINLFDSRVVILLLFLTIPVEQAIMVFVLRAL